MEGQPELAVGRCAESPLDLPAVHCEVSNMGLLDALGLKPRRSVAAAAPKAETPGAAPNASASGGDLAAAASAASAASTGSAAAPAVDKNQGAYISARAAVQKLVDGLNAHAQKSRIAGPIGQANAKLVAADTHSTKKEWPEAVKRLNETKAICTAAKKLADDWAGYAARRGTALALGMSFDSADNPQLMAAVNGVLAQADALANAAPPNFTAAVKKLAEITDILKPIVAALIKTVKARLATIQKTSAGVQAFAKADIDAGVVFIANADRAFAAGDWSLCRQNSIAAIRLLGPAVRMVERRGPYDIQRVITVAAVAQVKALLAVKDRAIALDALVTQADVLAGHDTRKFEEGLKVLQDTAARAAMWKALDTTVAAANKDRTAADADLAALDKHAAATQVAAQRDAVRKLLLDAKNLASNADAAAEPAQAWASVATALTRARADLAAAKKLADGLAVVSDAQAAAAKPGDAAAMKTALDKLVADGKLAAKAAHADKATAEFKTFNEQSAAAAAALKVPDAAAAAKALAAAATALAAAKTIQSGHGQFVAELGAAEAALKALQGSPRAAAIKLRIDVVSTALSDAKAKDKAHDGPGAITALRSAKDAVAAAKAADHDRAAFDTEAAALAKRITATKEALEKAALETLAADAKKLADALTFPAASKALKQLKVRLDKTKLEATIKANPSDPNIAKIANKMVEDGGAATVDAMIQAQPNGNDTHTLNALAEGRYGVKFTSGAPLPGGDPAQAMKAICGMFATIPQDVRKHPSIKGVSHEDAVGSAGGGHTFDDAKINMVGRPGAIQQQFGAVQTNTDPKTGSAVAQLPAAIDADCEAKDNNPVEYLAFAAAHEVGHGVDDARGFMATHGAGVKYGGWVTYPASLQPLADIVGADARFAEFYKTPEQRRYILDKLMSAPAVAPAVVAGSVADNARIAFDQWHAIATSQNVYRRQGDCDAIKIGTMVYHEAYARTWVGYLAAARSKALTGYQFRAPAEWFAELYAGYRSGKLKDTHPAMVWLKTL